MIVQFHKKFFKDLESLSLHYRKRIEQLTVVTVPALTNIHDIPGAEKLKGYRFYYKIRIGDYRIGIEETDTGVIFHRVMHRKEIYRYFPG